MKKKIAIIVAAILVVMLLVYVRCLKKDNNSVKVDIYDTMEEAISNNEDNVNENE